MNALFYLATNPAIPIVAALLVFLSLRWFTVAEDRQRTEWLFIFCVPILPFFLWMVRCALSGLTRLSMPTYDLYAYRFDALLGSPAFRVAQAADSHLWSRLVMLFIYELFSPALIGTLAAYIWLRPKDELRPLIEAFALNLILVVGFYLLIPVCGPRYAFPSFPQIPYGIVPFHTMTIPFSPPNGMPSAHVSSALLVCWFLRYWRWGKIAGVLFAFLTVLSVLATGEHYLLDAICAVPYTTGILWLSGNLSLEFNEQYALPMMRKAG
jgi:hypothetical protein